MTPGGSIGDVSVSWRVAGGTAFPDMDYSASGGTLNFLAGDTRQGELTMSEFHHGMLKGNQLVHKQEIHTYV